MGENRADGKRHTFEKGRKTGVNVEGSEEIGECDVYMRLAMRE
jgi:hypothetical protein